MKVLVGVLLLVFVAGCGEERQDARAESMVHDFLEAVSGGAPDRGWSLLLSDVRTRIFGGDLDAYIEEADSVDWSEFSWSIVGVERDEPYSYRVQIAVEGALPALVDRITIFDDAPDAGPTFVVRMHEALGGTGIDGNVPSD